MSPLVFIDVSGQDPGREKLRSSEDPPWRDPSGPLRFLRFARTYRAQASQGPNARVGARETKT